MTSETFVLLSGTLTFGVPMLLAVLELLSLDTIVPGRDELPPGEPFVPAPKPLPQCLLPVPVSAERHIPTRVLEQA